MSAEEQTVLLQLSDPHLRAQQGESDSHLERAVEAAAGLQPRPAAVLLSGDVADEPSAQVYERAARIVRSLGVPVHAVPGNHDQRDLLAMRFAGRETASGAPATVAADCGALRLVGCDTSVADRPGGALPDDQLEWLAATLSAAPQRPTLLALHHPPVACGIRAMDAIALRAPDASRLESLLHSHPQVLAVTCGHVHRTAMTRFAGRPLLICPSTSSSLRLDLRAQEGLPLQFTDQPLGFAVHTLLEGRLVSHVQPLAAA